MWWTRPTLEALFPSLLTVVEENSPKISQYFTLFLLLLVTYITDETSWTSFQILRFHSMTMRYALINNRHSCCLAMTFKRQNALSENVDIFDHLMQKNSNFIPSHLSKSKRLYLIFWWSKFEFVTNC